MTSINKNVALLVGLAVIASVSTAYALMQDSSSQNGVQAEHGKFLGHVTLALYGPDGNIKAYRQTDNLVTLNGDNATSNKLFFGATTGARKLSVCSGGSTCSGNSVGNFQWIGVGSTNTNPTVLDSDLLGAVGSHKGGPSAVSNGTGGHGTAQIQTTFAAGKITNSSNVNIVEAGLFDSQNSGSGITNMFARQIFSAISVGSADTLQITWTISIT